MSDDHLPFSVQATQTESGKQITFHVQDDTLGDFITKLLGQPQSIRKRFPAIFQLDHGWFNNLHELLTQRISQQNRYKLMQFSAKIYFEDGLVRTVNSAEAFASFVEVKPLISVGCSMTWTFLIFFASKPAPEKPEVKVTVMSEIVDKVSERFFLPLGLEAGFIELEINHTERTWGDDIMSMLLGHVNSHIKHLGKVRQLIYDNAITIGLVLSITCIITAPFVTSAIHYVHPEINNSNW